MAERAAFNDPEEKLAAVWIPAFVPESDVLDRARRVAGRRDGCFHIDQRSMGRWVCVLPAEHEGRHG